MGLLLTTLLALTACGESASNNIKQQLESRGLVELRTAVPGDWERVCILGPYSNNEAATATLGFNWSVEKHSSISYSDGISLLVFVHGRKVVTALEHPRRSGDFSKLSGRCFSREKAHFVQRAQSDDDWPWLVPRNGA